jgi:hypothetical protein
MLEPAQLVPEQTPSASWRSQHVDGTFGWRAAPTSSSEALRRAIIVTLIYADLFDHALTCDEIHRYLIGQAASAAAVVAMLDNDAELRLQIAQTQDRFHLTGRLHLANIRRERVAASAGLWPVAERYAARIARLPFVRLVGVTGALAMNNARPDDDIDLFILAQPGRLWLCRLLVLGVVKLAARQGYVLCPNFFLSTDHLRLSERNLFTAHEVVQMVPLERNPWYGAFMEANGWVADFLPNAFAGGRAEARRGSMRRLAARLVGGLLSARFFDPVERWEMQRKVQRLSRRFEDEGGSVEFSADECRGHFAAHDARILAAYRQRLAEYGDGTP